MTKEQFKQQCAEELLDNIINARPRYRDDLLIILQRLHTFKYNGNFLDENDKLDVIKIIQEIINHISSKSKYENIISIRLESTAIFIKEQLSNSAFLKMVTTQLPSDTNNNNVKK